jgi:hypothetical protein
MSTTRALPFRFLAAARYAPQWEEALEKVMLNCVAETEKLPGKTIVMVDAGFLGKAFVVYTVKAVLHLDAAQ